MSIVQGIQFKKEFRCFPKGTTIDFEGANFVVILGENGSGKSTLLQAIDNEFKKESFFDRKNEDLKKSCNVVLDKKIDPKKSVSIMLDYLLDNPKNTVFFSEDVDAMMIEIQSKSISSGQATQMGIAHKMGKFLRNLTELPSVILIDQPETALDVGSMVQICFILMMRIFRLNMQLIISTHSSDWIRAMYIAHTTINDDMQNKISFKFIDLGNLELKIENMEHAVMLNNNKQIDALNRYIENAACLIDAFQKSKKKNNATKSQTADQTADTHSKKKIKSQKPKQTSGNSKKLK